MALPRFLLTLATALSLTQAVWGQRGVLYTVQGDEPLDRLGITLVPLDDVDGDDFPDFSAGAEAPPNGLSFLGYVVICSGRTGEILHRIDGTVRRELLGFYLATMADLNGDGKRELVIGGRDRKVISVHDAVTADPLLEITIDPPSEMSSAQRYADPGDVDGDGVPDLLYGDLNFHLGDFNQQGRVSMYSGATGEELWRRRGQWRYSATGSGLVGLRDVDGDGLPDVTAAEMSAGLQFTRLLILKGNTGEVIGELPTRDSWLGRTIVRFGDLNGDGFVELGVAARRGKGRVYVISGNTFEVLYRFDGFEPGVNGFTGDWLGEVMSDAGDLDGDGTSDFLINSVRFSGDEFGPLGRVYLHSGATGRTLAAYEGQGGAWFWAASIAPLGDANGDGKPEFLVGSPANPIGARLRHATIRALTYDASLPTFLRGDANGNGRVSVTDAIVLLQVLFRGRDSDCPLALDLNRAPGLEPTDAAYLLRHLFSDGFAPPPPPPFPECARHGGIFTSSLSCERSTCAGD